MARTTRTTTTEAVTTLDAMTTDELHTARQALRASLNQPLVLSVIQAVTAQIVRVSDVLRARGVTL